MQSPSVLIRGQRRVRRTRGWGIARDIMDACSIEANRRQRGVALRDCARAAIEELFAISLWRSYALSAPSWSPLMYQRWANPKAISPGVIAMM